MKSLKGNRPPGPAGTWVPHAQTKPPRWMMRHAFKRGLAFFVGAPVVNLAVAYFAGPQSGVAEAASLICGIVSVAGIVLMVCGVLNFLTRKRRPAEPAKQ